MNGSVIPFVIDGKGTRERSYDIFSRLLKDRIVFIGGPIDDYSANIIIAQILYLMSEGKNQPINVYINSPGGSVTAGLGIYDTLQFVPCEINTFCIGQAASMGAFLLNAGSPGSRHALRSSRIMIHQPWGGAQGTASDIQIQAKEIDRLKTYLNERMVEHNSKGKTLEEMIAATDRDYFMTAEEALEFGLVDEVVTTLSQD